MTRVREQVFSDTGLGILVSLLAFLGTLGLLLVFHKHYYTALIGAVAVACLLRGWRSGVAALVTCVCEVALLMPPTFHVQIDTPGEVLTLLVFAFSAGVICFITYISDRRRRDLTIAESQRRSSEQWLQTAQQFTRFWTWEIDLDRKLVKWVNPYGELKTQVYEPLESWMLRIHAEDRASWLVGLEEARYSNSFELQFRVPGPMHDRFYIAKGMMTADPVTLQSRLVGISVQVQSPRTSVPVQEDQSFSLYGLQDLLDNLSENPSLDPRAQRNLEMARSILLRVLPQDTSRQRPAV